MFISTLLRPTKLILTRLQFYRKQNFGIYIREHSSGTNSKIHNKKLFRRKGEVFALTPPFIVKNSIKGLNFSFIVILCDYFKYSN